MSELDELHPQSHFSPSRSTLQLDGLQLQSPHSAPPHPFLFDYFSFPLLPTNPTFHKSVSLGHQKPTYPSATTPTNAIPTLGRIHTLCANSVPSCVLTILANANWPKAIMKVRTVVGVKVLRDLRKLLLAVFEEEDGGPDCLRSESDLHEDGRELSDAVSGVEEGREIIWRALRRSRVIPEERKKYINCDTTQVRNCSTSTVEQQSNLQPI